MTFVDQNAHEIIEQIETELNIDFNYDYDLFDQSHVESFSASGSKADILNTCFTLLDKNYSKLEESLYVIKSDKIPEAQKIHPVKFSIKIVDDVKTELSYGLVLLEGLNDHYETNLDGEVIIEGYYSPAQRIEFSYLGYQSKSILLNKLNPSKINLIVLKEEEHMLDEIVIRDTYLFFEDADLNANIISDGDGGIGGTLDNDVLTRVQSIAGVYNTTESLSDMQIRGGTVGQTQLQWNNIELYQSNLFLGNVSSINPFMADVIMVNKNGGSADDPGHSSGSIHMQSDHYSSSKTNVKLFSDLLYMNAGFGTSFFDNKVRFKAAFRNSVSSLFESPYYERLYDNIFQVGPIATDRFWDEKYRDNNPDDIDIQNEKTFDRKLNFGDYSLSVLAKPSSRMTLDVNYMNIHSNFSYEQVGDYDGLNLYLNNTENSGLSSKFKYQITPFWKTNVIYSSSNFSRVYDYYDNKELMEEADYFVQENTIQQSSIDMDHSFTHNNHEWKIGIGYQTWDLFYGESYEDLGPDTPQSQRAGNEKSIFLDYTLTIADLIKFRNGTRWSDYSLTFDNRVFIEPRIHVSLLPTENFTIHAHYGTYHRNLNKQYRYAALSVEDDFWYISDEAVTDPNEWLWMVGEVQYSLGVRYNKGPFSLEVDVYNKKLSNLWSASFDFENEINPWRYLDSNARGLELSLFYQNDWLNLSNTYELMSDVLDLEDSDLRINNPYVQPFKSALNAEFKWNHFKFVTRWNFATGRYYSEPEAVNTITKSNGDISFDIIYDDALNLQLDDYHRLDLSFYYDLPVTKDFNATFGLSILNTYNRQNVISTIYQPVWTEEPYEVKPVHRHGMPFLPNVSILLEF